jgi:hypothetical protein
MNRKLLVCLLAAGWAGGMAAQDTNVPAAAISTNQDDSLAARRARIEAWRAGFSGISHSQSTNPLDGTNLNALPGDNTDAGTNALSLEERRARIHAKLVEWDRSLVPTNSISSSTNNPPAGVQPAPPP